MRRLCRALERPLGDLAVDQQRQAVHEGHIVEVVARHLLEEGGVHAGYDTLLRQVWGGRGHGDPKLVRAIVKRLRRKLGDDAADPAYIFNERGVGYRMARPGEP